MKTIRLFLSLIQRTDCVLAIAASLLLAASSTLKADQIPIIPGSPPGLGVEIVQVDFLYDPTFSGGGGLVISNSNTGQVVVDPGVVCTNLGKTSGFLNARSSEGWVVHNLPLSSEFPYARISTALKLDVPTGQRSTMLGAYVAFSDEPLASFTGPEPLQPWPVGKDTYNAGGANYESPPGPIYAPAANLGVVHLGPIGVVIGFVQPGHPNVQAAMNQCWPAGVANSLQWLEDTYGIVVPHDNVPGIGISGPPPMVVPANSLAGQLDLYMQRPCFSRVNGGPTWDINALYGKLSYLANNGLGDLIMNHQAINWPGNLTTNSLTSTGNGTPTFAFILGQFMSGADVELAYARGTTVDGHVVKVVGAGYNAQGEPYVMYVSDHVQTHQDPNDNQGTAVVDYSRVDGPDQPPAPPYYHLTDVKGPHRVNAQVGPIITVVVSEMPSPRLLNSKWCQLPGARVFLNNTNAFGGDRPSDFNWSSPNGRPAVADDFRSDGRPIATVRWWGSYLNNHVLGDEDGYMLSFFNDLRPTNTFSRPTNLLATYVAPLSKVAVTNTSKLGLDGKAIYEYTANLRDICLYYVASNATSLAKPWSFLEQSNTLYWLAIDAERGRTFALTTNNVWTNYASGKPVLAENFWGWHTSPCTNFDLSVTGALTASFNYTNWNSNSVFYGEMDQAFALLTFAAAPAVQVSNSKWLQRPDRTCTGVAVLATEGSGTPIVADDFRCNRSGPIPKICLWGAWQEDQRDPNAQFRLRIYRDVPTAGNVPSHPGDLLWEKTFTPNPSFANPNTASAGVVASNLCESFYNPSQLPGQGTASRDSKLYQYSFYCPTNQAFFQTNGQIYWLSVTACNTANRFGWKTAITNDHFMDDAAFGTQTNPPAAGWTDLHSPTNHPYCPQALDMAFALGGSEVDYFSNSWGKIDVVIPGVGPQSIALSGTSMWHVEVGPDGEASDPDTNGLDQVTTEIVSLDLHGTCAAGPVSVRVRDAGKSPYHACAGEIEESGSLLANHLDVRPFSATGVADSFFDVYLEIQIGSEVLHNVAPIGMGQVITYKPPVIGTRYDWTQSLPLYNEAEQTPTYTLQAFSYIPASLPRPVVTSITIPQPGLIEIHWDYGGELQAAPTAVGGSWTPVATSSPYVGGNTNTMQFFRVYRP